MKALIATHGTMASGVKNTLGLFVDVSGVRVIDAYVDDSDYTLEIAAFMDEVGDDEIGLIFTDLVSGSVNQKVVEMVQKDNIKILSGFNVALIAELLSSEPTTDAEIIEALEMGRQQMQFITRSELAAPSDDSDESFLD